MSKVEYAYPLDTESKNYIRIIMEFEEGLKDLVIIYYTTEGEEEVPLVTYDLAHGFPHRDIRYLDEKDKRRKKRFGVSMDEFYSIALDDINQNWRRYLDEYRKVKK